VDQVNYNEMVDDHELRQLTSGSFINKSSDAVINNKQTFSLNEMNHNKQVKLAE